MKIKLYSTDIRIFHFPEYSGNLSLHSENWQLFSHSPWNPAKFALIHTIPWLDEGSERQLRLKAML